MQLIQIGQLVSYNNKKNVNYIFIISCVSMTEIYDLHINNSLRQQTTCQQNAQTRLVT